MHNPSPTEQPSPQLFHLAEPSVWNAQMDLPHYTPTAFAEEGFVHCSTAAQLPGTAQRFYAHREMVCLTLDATALPVVYENLEGGSVLFPHVYQPLPKTAVREAKTVNIDAQGHFSD